MQIKYVDWGIANRYDNYIEINEKLKDYPELHRSIISHELRHTDNKKFNKKDLMIDLTESNVNYGQLLRFMLKNPKSFLQLSPVIYKEKTIFFDFNALLYWSLLIGVISASVYFAI